MIPSTWIMRNVAVTEGDKVEVQIQFGWEVDAYPVNEIAEAVAAVSRADIDTLVEHSAVNRVVVGSSPTGGGDKKACKRICLQAFFDFILWE